MQDPQVRSALLLLGRVLDYTPDKKGPEPIPKFLIMGDEYYFLWALERVAVAYGLQTIGNQDWYRWGSDILIPRQGPDGSWHGKFWEGGVDTCFALLFLRQANLSKDLTVTLKGHAPIPGVNQAPTNPERPPSETETKRSSEIPRQEAEKKPSMPSAEPAIVKTEPAI